VNVGISNRDELFPAISVTLSWQVEYVAFASAVNVIVFSHEIAAVVALEHDPL
jgi:hypothetical protein